jgi:hypothetical protein
MAIGDNPIRDEMIRAAVATCNAAGQPVTLASLRAILPNDFGLDDVDDWRTLASDTGLPGCGDNPGSGEAATADGPSAAVAAEPVSGVLDVTEPSDTMDTPTGVRLTPQDPATVREQLRELRDQLANQRAKVQTLSAKLRTARGHVADALQTWVSGIAPRMTATELAQQHCREQAELRRLEAEGKIAPRTPGNIANTAVDRGAAYGHGGNASDFLRKQMRSGYRRGSLPVSARGVKLPSAR